MSKVRVLDIREFDGNEKLVDFYCSALPRHLLAHSKNITAPHKHNFFLTVLFTQGSGTHEIDFESHEVKPGSVFMLNPGQAHHWDLSEDIDGIIFFHSQEFFEVSFTNQSLHDFPFFLSTRNPSGMLLNESQLAAVSRAFQSVLQEYRDRDDWSRQKIVALLNSIYIDLSRAYAEVSGDAKQTTKHADYMDRLDRLLERHYKEEKSPAYYADQLNITIRHLNRLTQESFGKSTTQLLTERVILEAKRLIVYDANSLAKISYELGYEDYAYFSRLFKKWTGLTPSSFGSQYKKA